MADPLDLKKTRAQLAAENAALRALQVEIMTYAQDIGATLIAMVAEVITLPCGLPTDKLERMKAICDGFSARTTAHNAHSALFIAALARIEAGAVGQPANKLKL